MKIQFPIIIELSDVIKSVVNQLETSFKESIPFFQEQILSTLRNNNVQDALTYIDTLRKKLAEMDNTLGIYHEFLIKYQQTVLSKMSENKDEG